MGDDNYLNQSYVKCCFFFQVPTGFTVLAILQILGFFGMIGGFLGQLASIANHPLSTIVGLFGQLTSVAYALFVVLTVKRYRSSQDEYADRLNFVWLCNYGIIANAIVALSNAISQAMLQSNWALILGVIPIVGLNAALFLWWRCSANNFAA